MSNTFVKAALKYPHEHILIMRVPKEDFMPLLDELHANGSASQLSINIDANTDEYVVEAHVWH